jgi:transposase
VSVASVVKWPQRWRASGSAAAKPMGGWRPLRLTGERTWLLARIAEKPDLTLRAVVAELAERGTPASYGAVWRFFKHEGITFKKRCTPANRIAPIARRRTRWKTHQGRLDPRRLVFIDETWAKTNMTRRHRPAAGRGPGRQGAAPPLAYADFFGSAAPRPHHRSLRQRQANQRHQFSRRRLRLRRRGSSSFWCRTSAPAAAA